MPPSPARSSDHRDYQRVPRVVTAMARDAGHGAVSYTHLTLPTIYSV